MSRTQLELCVLFVFVFSAICDSARILSIITAPTKSHHILGSELTRALADAGHDVTYYTSYKGEYTPKNPKGKYKQIELYGLVEAMDETFKGVNMFDMDDRSLFFMFFFGHMTLQFTESVLKHPEIQKLVQSNEKFDVVLFEQFSADALKSFQTHFSAHLVLYSAVGTTWFVNHVSGNPILPSYHPEEIFLTLPAKMNFWQRLQNTFYTAVLSTITHLYFYPKHDELVKKYISPELSVYDNLYNQSLVLVNTHSSVSPAYPQVPQMVFIGGFHIKAAKKLPNDLQAYLDNSKHGVILFSMGSVLRSSDMTNEKRDIILKTFKKFNLNVLWKWEDEDLPNQPNNVKTAKWLPQSDILGHPNVKLFITHCGHGSFTESVYNGKPMVALPIFGDQPANALKVEEFGLGVTLSLADMTEESFTKAIKDVLETPKYSANAKHRSALYNDRQVKAIDEAIYWIEYVIRHNGATHLRVTYLDMPWYQYYLVDVAVFLSSIIVGVVLILKALWSRIWNKKNSNKKLKKN